MEGGTAAMKAQDYAATLKVLAEVGQMLEPLDLVGFRHAIERAEAVGPVVDPTLYRRATRDPVARLELEMAKTTAELARRWQQARIDARAKLMESLPR